MSRRVAKRRHVLEPCQVEHAPDRLARDGGDHPLLRDAAYLRQSFRWVVEVFEHFKHEDEVERLVGMRELVDRLAFDRDTGVTSTSFVHKPLLYIARPQCYPGTKHLSQLLRAE